jgi:hypothetical protein
MKTRPRTHSGGHSPSIVLWYPHPFGSSISSGDNDVFAGPLFFTSIMDSEKTVTTCLVAKSSFGPRPL